MPDPNALEPGGWEFELPERGVRGVRVGAAAGARHLGACLYELDPGGGVSPYHAHHANEELLVVLSGRPSVRTPAGARELAAGAVVAFPAGPDGAHRVFNASEAPARVLLVSTANVPDVAEYGDTGALLVNLGAGTPRAYPGDTGVELAEVVQQGLDAALSREPPRPPAPAKRPPPPR